MPQLAQCLTEIFHCQHYFGAHCSAALQNGAVCLIRKAISRFLRMQAQCIDELPRPSFALIVEQHRHANALRLREAVVVDSSCIQGMQDKVGPPSSRVAYNECTWLDGFKLLNI